MEVGIFLAFLSLFTIVAVIGFALWSKKRTEDRRHDDDAPKSRLAKDAPDR